MKIIQIDANEALMAKLLYKKVGALRDLIETINYHPEKEYLRDKVEAELKEDEEKVYGWWKDIVNKYKTKFSDNAVVNFEDGYIEDSDD